MFKMIFHCKPYSPISIIRTDVLVSINADKVQVSINILYGGTIKNKVVQNTMVFFLKNDLVIPIIER